MNLDEIKELLIHSLDENSDPGEISSRIEHEGISYDFRPGFTETVLGKLFPIIIKINRESEYLQYAFRSIAISGIAAIILLLISILIREGSFSVNSLLGLRDSCNRDRERHVWRD